MELFILILPISGALCYCIKRNISAYHLQQYTFDRISKELPTKGLTKLEVSDRTDDNLEETDQNNRVFTGPIASHRFSGWGGN
jgi:hypothetical protein